MSAETDPGAAPAYQNLPPRLGLLDPADLDEAQRAVYDAITGGPRASQAGTVPITDDAGRLLGPFAVMLLTPEVGNAMQQVGAKIRFAAALTGQGTGTRHPERRRPAAQRLRATRARARRPRGRPDPAQVNAALTGRVPDGLTDSEALVGRLPG